VGAASSLRTTAVAPLREAFAQEQAGTSVSTEAAGTALRKSFCERSARYAEHGDYQDCSAAVAGGLEPEGQALPCFQAMT
jgi:hypothetical protein